MTTATHPTHEHPSDTLTQLDVYSFLASLSDDEFMELRLTPQMVQSVDLEPEAPLRF